MRSSRSLKSVGTGSEGKSQASETPNPYFTLTQPKQSHPGFKLKISSNIESELSKAFTNLKKIQAEIKGECKRLSVKKSQYTIDDLFAIQDSIKSKDRDIKRMSTQMKEMKLFKRKQERELKQQRVELQSPYTSEYLSSKNEEQIRVLKKTLEQLQNMHSKKLVDHQNKKAKLRELDSRYRQYCRVQSVEYVGYQEYLSREQVQKETRSTSSKLSEFSKKLTSMTIKEIVNTTSSVQELEHTEHNLLELKNRKEILEGSLRTTKRKNQKEVLELKQTLQELIEENKTLETRCYEKYREKQAIDELKKP